MILAAGRGERLRPLTDRVPKPLVEVRGRPLLEHQLEWLRAAGITEVVINLHHLGAQIESRIGDGARFGVRIRYSRETERLETGGGIVLALPLLGDAAFLVLNADIFTDFPLATLEALPDWADVHLLVTPRPEFRATGDFEVAGGRVTSRGTSYVYCGIAIVHPRLLAGFEPKPFSLRERFFDAIEASRASAQIWSGYWTDIGDRAQLDAANAHR